MTTPPQKDSDDWVDQLSRAAGALGFNEVRVRWKLEGVRKRWRDRVEQTEGKARHMGYAHKVCPRCGQINDRHDKRCANCEAALSGWSWELMHRFGLRIPVFQSVSALLGLLMVLVYARCIAAEWPHGSIFGFSVKTLYLHGGHWAPAVEAGQVWRWLTAVFLHAGLWHIGFNLFALSQVGPAVEQIFGRGRMLLLFVVTGVVANIGSYIWGMYGVGIGASGAIMGLCGVAAGWGQRDGTTIGKNTRNFMIKWGLYTLVFGYMIGADNAAHAVGFVSGAAFGYVLKPASLRKTDRMWLEVAQAVVGAVAALVAVVLCLWPPGSPAAW